MRLNPRMFRSALTAVTALLVCVCLALPAAAVMPLHETPARTVNTFDALKRGLESDDDAPITLMADITVPQDAKITVSGDKVLNKLGGSTLIMLGQLSIPAGNSLLLEGVGLMCRSEDIPSVSLEGRLEVREAQAVFYVGGAGIGLSVPGGTFAVRDGLFGVALSGSGVGAFCDVGGSMQLTDSVMQVVSDNTSTQRVSVGVYNKGGAVKAEGCITVFNNSDMSIALLNETGDMQFSGGEAWVGNGPQSAAVYNMDNMTFFDQSLYLNSSGSSGIDNLGGNMIFRSCTLQFYGGTGTVAGLYNEEGRMAFDYTAFVVAGAGGTCVENAGGSFSSNGENVLLRIADGRLLLSDNGETLGGWAREYKGIELRATDRQTGAYIENYAAEGSWQGHDVYGLNPATMELLPCYPVLSTGETLTITAEGYLDTKLRVSPEDLSAGPVLSAAMQPISPLAPYLFAATLLIALAGFVYQSRWGKTYRK